jgi:hypothetical protein
MIMMRTMAFGTLVEALTIRRDVERQLAER